MADDIGFLRRTGRDRLIGSFCISANISGVVNSRMSSRLPTSLAACRRMKLTLALRTKPSTSKSAGMLPAVRRQQTARAGAAGRHRWASASKKRAAGASVGAGAAYCRPPAPPAGAAARRRMIRPIDHHHRHHQQTDHQHRSEFLAETEVRSQRGQAEAGGEAGERTHPRTLGLAAAPLPVGALAALGAMAG
jgi:hypothetical protein